MRLTRTLTDLMAAYPAATTDQARKSIVDRYDRIVGRLPARARQAWQGRIAGDIVMS